MPKRYILCMIVLFSLMLLNASKLSETIQKAISNAPDDSTALEIIKGYAAKTDDVEDLRILQNYWLQIDDKSCIRHFDILKKKNPKDPKYIYLQARTLDSIEEMMKVARKLIKKYPNFEYSYRLLLAPYQQHLFTMPNEKGVEKSPIYKDYKKDRKFFEVYLKKYPKEENALYLMIARQIWEKDVAGANLNTAKALDMNASFLGWQFYTDFYLRTNQLDLLKAYIRKMIDESKQATAMTPEGKENQFVVNYSGLLFENDYYAEFQDFIKENPQYQTLTPILFMTLLTYINQHNIDAAFETIDKMMDKPNEFYNILMTREDFIVLQSDPRWEPRMNQMKALWDAGANDRKIETLSKKFSRPAPDWELKDKDGSIVKLSDQKGKIVILDFWATWCGPCKMAMPVLSDWMQYKMPQGVKVYSINVWEKDPTKALSFMEENGYHMTLLYGMNNLSKDYNFDGIPYLCVIDKEGNIRFEETGYSEELAENLSIWVEDLQ